MLASPDAGPRSLVKSKDDDPPGGTTGRVCHGTGGDEAPVPDAGTFDRAGLWINASSKGFKIVDLTADGPAAKAGLKVGEYIAAVDGVAATSINLSEFRQRLRDDKPGTVVKITIADDKHTRNVALTLADQI